MKYRRSAPLEIASTTSLSLTSAAFAIAFARASERLIPAKLRSDEIARLIGVFGEVRIDERAYHRRNLFEHVGEQRRSLQRLLEKIDVRSNEFRARIDELAAALGASGVAPP